MELNLNSQRLKHIKRGESVFEALQHLGGKASSKELVQQIASSLNESEEAVQSDVKQVLRAAVVNGYIVRHGKNYLLSRSCRSLHTDSGKSRYNATSSKKKKADVRTNSISTFPNWWNRFWHRFVTVKNRDDDSSAEQQISSNDVRKTHSTELNKFDTETSMNLNPSDQIDAAQTNESKDNNFVSSILLQEADSKISKPESSVPIQECESKILLEPITSDTPTKELEHNISFHSIPSIESKHFLVSEMLNQSDYQID